MGRRAAASQRPVSAARGVAGSSGGETIDGGSPSRAPRCTILDLGTVCSGGAIGAGLCLLAQIEERGSSHIRDFAVVALLSAAVSRPGVGQGTPVLQ